jgi:hypothetical protein
MLRLLFQDIRRSVCMRRDFSARAVVALTLLGVSLFDAALIAADIQRFEFEVRESAGIRRRNDVVTIRTADPKIAGHNGGFLLRQAGKPTPAQIRVVELPGELRELVVDFIGHFQPFEARKYVLELGELKSEEPAEGLSVSDSGDVWVIDSSGLVTWTIRKDLAGLLDFSWKETDYIAAASPGLSFTMKNGPGHDLSESAPTRALVERSGPLLVALRFEYDDWPPGTSSRVQLEFPRTKSWIHATWTIDDKSSDVSMLGAALDLRLDGEESLVDFGAGDFVYATVTRNQEAMLDAGPRDGSTIPWSVWHGAPGESQQIFVAPRDVPTPKVHGWAHVMDDKRCTALAVADFGDATADSITVHGDGRLNWQRDFPTDSPEKVRKLEFWLHFVTMPVHIGARTSPRSMQEPLEVEWLSE